MKDFASKSSTQASFLHCLIHHVHTHFLWGWFKLIHPPICVETFWNAWVWEPQTDGFCAIPVLGESHLECNLILGLSAGQASPDLQATLLQSTFQMVRIRSEAGRTTASCRQFNHFPHLLIWSFCILGPVRNISLAEKTCNSLVIPCFLPRGIILGGRFLESIGSLRKDLLTFHSFHFDFSGLAEVKKHNADSKTNGEKPSLCDASGASRPLAKVPRTRWVSGQSAKSFRYGRLPWLTGHRRGCQRKITKILHNSNSRYIEQPQLAISRLKKLLIRSPTYPAKSLPSVCNPLKETKCTHA